MNIVLGLLKADFGDIFLGNTKLTTLAIHQRSKLGIAYLPQQTSIFRGLTVYENLLGIAQIVKKNSADQNDIVEKLMAEFSITHLRDIKATALSGGERRRTEIARCLISNPKVLLLDEPFAGVDLLSIQDIKSLLLKLQARGCAVLVTDHNASQLLSVVDRAYVIANGTIVANYGRKISDILIFQSHFRFVDTFLVYDGVDTSSCPSCEDDNTEHSQW